MTDHAEAIRQQAKIAWVESQMGVSSHDTLAVIQQETDALAAECDALRAQYADMRSCALRWKRVALAYLHDPQEYEAAWQELIDHGDVEDDTEVSS